MSKRNPILYIIVSIIVIASPFALNESFKYFQGLASMKFEPIYKLVNIIISAAAFGILMPFHVLLASRLDKKARLICQRWQRTVGVCRIRCSRLRLRRISLFTPLLADSCGFLHRFQGLFYHREFQTHPHQ